MKFARGLVVGKFCPLHRGHQLVIDTARRLCREVIVISYTKPEIAGCGRDLRDRWLSDLYPDVTRLVVDDAWPARLQLTAGSMPYRALPNDGDPDEVHRDFVGWLCWSVLGAIVDVVFTSEAYGDGFAQALTRYFRDKAGVGPTVRHLSVDPLRRQVPIAGSTIRADPHRHRDYLSDEVYRSFVRRVAILGGESSGKTKLAEALASCLDTALVPEFGRELWEEREGKLRDEDMVHIATVQVDREEQAALKARRWLFCDTTPLTTLFYAMHLFGHADRDLCDLAERPYDAVFLCAPDFDFVQDGTRVGADFRALQHGWYESELARRGISFQLVTGSLRSRIDTAVRVLTKGRGGAGAGVVPKTGA